MDRTPKGHEIVTISGPDIVNGLFEAVGAGMALENVRKLLYDRSVVGFWWPLQAFFTIWGFWNLYYYPSLDQWISFLGGMLLAAANLVWVCLAITYSRRNRVRR
jgi:hypothetical protein